MRCFCVNIYLLLLSIASYIVLSAVSSAPSSYFYGWDTVRYFRYLADAYLKQFPWQVQVSFVLLAVSSLMIIFLSIAFARSMVQRSNEQRELERCKALLEKPFRAILTDNRKMTWEEMEYICCADRTEIQEFSSTVLTRLILSLRMEQSDKVYIPNMQHLCGMTGVRDALEHKLIKGNDVERTLQILITLPIRIGEGALAIYTSNKNTQIRELARSYYGFCSKAEPFSFVMQDINEPFNLWYPTTFHRLCSWHRTQGHPTPQLLSLADNSQNEDKKALFISEIPYWGTEKEKRGVEHYLASQNQKCCLAAIHALSIIADPRSEQMLIDNYNRQFPQAKRETLLAIAKINTGKQTEFFRQAYLYSSSHKTRAVALSCLFNYGEEGRRIFHELAQAGLDDNRFFMQIISSNEQ